MHIDGIVVDAYDGETVAAVFLASGQRVLRTTARLRTSRGVYCGMGLCHDCLVVVDGRPNVRACVTYVRDEMRIQTQSAYGSDANVPPRSAPGA